MKLIPLKVIKMTILLFAFSFILSCSKDSDLLLNSVLNDPEVSLEEKEQPVDEVSEDGLVTRTFSFTPTNDAYVQDSQGYNRSIIRLQEGFRTSYLMFDLSQINGSIEDAVLQFSIDSDEGDGNISIHKGSNTDWTEENLSENNAPTLDFHLGSLNKAYRVGAPEKVILDVANLKPEPTTLVMMHSSGNDLAFASKEHPSNKSPKLIITYKAPEGSPLIEQEEEQEEESSNENTQQENINQTDNNTASTTGAYFVTTNGSASNDGFSENSSWSIEHAFSTAIAGDVVYIKAGNYGNKTLIADNTGSVGNQIKFIGYTNSPGDLSSNQGSTFNYGDSLDSSKMPLLTGNAPNGEGQGTAIRVNEPFIHIENFQITKYNQGLVSFANEAYFKNIIISQMGDYNPAHTYPNATSNAFLNYSGDGIIVMGNNSELHNSFVINCGAQGITFSNGTSMAASNNKVYADSSINPMDYYFLIGPNVINSRFINTTAYRVGSLRHLGHGIGLKGDGAITGNVIDGFTIFNTFLEVQFPQTSNNTFKNGIIKKEAHVNDGTPEAGGIRLANGSNNNHFENIELDNCSILFQDWNDGLAGDEVNSSDNNTFDNILVNNAFSGIAFSYFHVDNHSSSADNNIFRNCTFRNLDFMYEIDRANSGTKLIDCTIDNVAYFSKERIKGGPTYSVNVSYQNCNWSNLGFPVPD